jgi:hypothetical protein
VARIFGRRLLRTPLDDVRRELDEYFEGRRQSFDLPLDLRVAPFPESVLRELALVPTARPRRTARSPPAPGTRRPPAPWAR